MVNVLVFYMQNDPMNHQTPSLQGQQKQKLLVLFQLHHKIDILMMLVVHMFKKVCRSSPPRGHNTNISYTYLNQCEGFFGMVFISCCSEDSMYIFTITGAKHEPMVALSIC